MSVLSRQPQLRGPDQPGREDELPRVAAAGRRLRARGHDGHRPARRAARPGLRRRRRLPEGHLADAPRRSRDLVEASVHEEMFTSSYGEVFDGDERWNSLEVPEGDRFAWDGRLHLRAPAVVPRERAARAVDARGHRRRARARHARRQRHDRPHLAGGRDQEGLAGRAVPERARRRAEGLQLLRLAPRQPRGDGARHVRQHPPAQPARAGHRGRRHALTCRTARRCRSTTRR